MGLHSGLAPTSTSRNSPLAEGMMAARGARSTDSNRRSLRVAAATSAPVFPGEMTASAFPSRTNSTARTIEQSFFFRTASIGLSSMTTTSEA